ncbi:hypothetical protein PsorP6_009922 [Peronosclerospora sorghi]|uniref:Uncharacterized protein n=1 Tax=Peronosclerospora sorghi TaxID=230839 RepID=A0ACC0VVC8_9STRA|nr:hypothetical protein PsorP6_009922 [Peronosclerospora sorghi]
MRSLDDSFASQLSNAVIVKKSDDDQVNAIYENAIRLLRQSSSMHFHQKYDLEPAVILHFLETLVHRSESPVALKVWNMFESELQVLPPVAKKLGGCHLVGIGFVGECSVAHSLSKMS